MHQVDAAGDLQHVLDHGLQGVAAGVGVAGVEAEPDLVGALGRGDGVEDPVDALEVAGHRVVAAGGVLDEQRQLDVGGLHRLAPVVEADGRVVVLVDVAAVDDQSLGADRGRRVDVLLEELARGDPDPVVGRGDVDDVGRVDVEVDARRGRVVPQSVGASGVADLGTLVALRVAEEELHEARAPGPRLGDRVGLVDVRADPGHVAQLSSGHRRAGEVPSSMDFETARTPRRCAPVRADPPQSPRFLGPARKLARPSARNFETARTPRRYAPGVPSLLNLLALLGRARKLAVRALGNRCRAVGGPWHDRRDVRSCAAHHPRVVLAAAAA